MALWRSWCKRPAAGVLGEQCGGAAVGQPRVAGHGADVDGGRARRRGAVGQEHRAAPAAGEQSRQQPRGARGEVDELEVAAFGADPGSLVGHVEVLDVEGEDLAGARRGFVEQSPERLLAQRHAVALPEALELRVGDRAGAVGWLAPALEREQLERGRGAVLVTGGPPQERVQGGEVAIPARRREMSPASLGRALQRAGLERLERSGRGVGPEVLEQRREHLAVDADGVRREVRAGEESLDGVAERRGVRGRRGRSWQRTCQLRRTLEAA